MSDTLISELEQLLTPAADTVVPAQRSDSTSAERLTIAGMAPIVGSAPAGFVQAGANAAARSMRDKMRERISVKDFGAVGDGSTNDTAAIVAAITYATSAWASTVMNQLQRTREIYFPPGDYLHDGFTISAPVALRGAGLQSTRLVKRTGTVGADIVISLDAPAYNYLAAGYPNPVVEIDDLTIMGPGKSDTVAGADGHGIYIPNTNAFNFFLYMSRVDITAHRVDGVRCVAYNCAGLIRDCYFQNNLGYGVLVNGLDWQFSNCLFGVNGQDGFAGFSTGYCQFVACNFYSNTRFGARLTDGGSDGGYDNHFIACSFDRNGRFGFYWDSAGDCTCSLTSCYLQKNSAAATTTADGDIGISATAGDGLTVVDVNLWLPGNVDYSPKTAYCINFLGGAGTVSLIQPRIKDGSGTFSTFLGTGFSNASTRLRVIDTRTGIYSIGLLSLRNSTQYSGLQLFSADGTAVSGVTAQSSSAKGGLLYLCNTSGTAEVSIAPTSVSGQSSFIGSDLVLGSARTLATPAGRVLKTPDGTGTNVGGSELSIFGGAGTGSAAGGALYFKVAPPGASGTSVNAQETRFHINATGIGFFGTTPIAKPALPAAATDAATTQSLANAIRNVLINYGLAS